MEFFSSENLNVVLGAIAGLVALGALISRYTATPKDDAFFARIKAMLKL